MNFIHFLLLFLTPIFLAVGGICIAIAAAMYFWPNYFREKLLRPIDNTRVKPQSMNKDGKP